MNVSLEEFLVGLENERRKRNEKRRKEFIVMRDYTHESIERRAKRKRRHRK